MVAPPTATTLVGFADRINPLGGPAAPLESRALLAAFSPSLMPRAGWHQGLAAGLSLLAAESIGHGVNTAIERVVGPRAPLAARLLGRSSVYGAGHFIAQLAETDDEPTSKASIRSAGRLMAAAAVGGIIYDCTSALRQRVPPRSAARPVLMGAGGAAVVLYHANHLLKQREAIVQGWSDEDKQATLSTSIGVAAATVLVGNGIGFGFEATRRGAVNFFGSRPSARGRRACRQRSCLGCWRGWPLHCGSGLHRPVERKNRTRLLLTS